jgi:hypothetical protein
VAGKLANDRRAAAHYAYFDRVQTGKASKTYGEVMIEG